MLSTNNNVLFVDDEEQTLRSIERVFQDESDVTVLKTSNPLKALDLIKKGGIAVVVSDNLMPEMRGTEFLSKVKAVSPDTVRIMMTAYADVPTAVEAINTDEVFRFILKPWENDDLIGSVKDAINRHNVAASLKAADEGTLLSLAQTIELKDPYTKGHCDRVAKYALMIAEAMNIPEETRKEIKYGSWLHDCGKIGVPESILKLPGRLNEQEMNVIKKHPLWGVDVIKHIHASDEIRNIILYHHEKCDGTGYPIGLSGDEIPVEAKIVAIADVYDALDSDRPYRKGYSREKVLGIMASMKSIHLDPEILELFFTLMSNEEGANA